MTRSLSHSAHARSRPASPPAAGRERLWETMTVEEMRLALRTTPTAILPLGVTEQHGYHLPLCTDTMDAFELARRVSARTGAVVAPALPYSFSGGELPGTINVTPAVMSLMVRDIVQSIVQNGFRQIVLMLGHGGSENFAALKDSLHLFLRHQPELAGIVLTFAPVWEFSPTWKRLFRSHDFHAGDAETSVVLALRPDLVRPDRMVQDVPRLAALMRQHPDNYQRVETRVPSRHVVPRVRQRPDLRVGVMGYPERATAATGRRMVAEIVTRLARLIVSVERQLSKPYREVRVRRTDLTIL